MPLITLYLLPHLMHFKMMMRIVVWVIFFSLPRRWSGTN